MMEKGFPGKMASALRVKQKNPMLSELRQRAEEILRDGSRKTPIDTEGMSPEELRWVVDELQIHQVELEIQRDELQDVQVELDVAREQYFELYDLAPIGYCTLSLAGLILRANLTATIFLGVGRDALLKQPFSQYVLRQDQDIYYQHRRLLFDSGQPQMCELRLVGGDGQIRWVRLDANVTRDEDSLATCRVTLADITSRKLAEEQNAKQEARYRHVQKMDSLGRLASGVAHDFNNKLAVIRGGIDLLLEKTELSGEIAPDLINIREATEDAAALVSQLLGFARRQKVAVQVLDCNESTARTLAMLRRLFGENITLDWQPAAGLWPVRMDPSQFDQIVTNLCINGRDAIIGSGRITITTANRSLLEADCIDPLDFVPGDYIELTVSDNGCGIDPANLEKIFEPFFSTKGADCGSGLGLASVYGIVKQNNGLIAVRSQLGLGTSLSVFLPSAVGSMAQPVAASSTESRPLVGGNETILVVEDEPVVLKVTVRMLTSLGYTVFGANDPKEAISVAVELSSPIDLVVTDMLMPGMNGIELVQMLRVSYPRLRALYISGYSFSAEVLQSALPANGRYLSKPFTKVELAVMVREVLASMP